MKRAIATTRPPVIAVAGWKKSGKTTLTVRLVEALVGRGYRVATLKHAHHAFQIDDEETDSARHRRAGASEVAIVSGSRWAIVGELRGAPEPDFEDVISWLGPADVVIVEGYKSAPVPKIEARRHQSGTRRRLADSDPNVIALAVEDASLATAEERARLPVHSLDDIAALADLVCRHLALPAPSKRAAAATEGG